MFMIFFLTRLDTVEIRIARTRSSRRLVHLYNDRVTEDTWTPFCFIIRGYLSTGLTVQVRIGGRRDLEKGRGRMGATLEGAQIMWTRTYNGDAISDVQNPRYLSSHPLVFEQACTASAVLRFRVRFCEVLPSVDGYASGLAILGGTP